MTAYIDVQDGKGLIPFVLRLLKARIKINPTKKSAAYLAAALGTPNLAMNYALDLGMIIFDEMPPGDIVVANLPSIMVNTLSGEICRMTHHMIRAGALQFESVTVIVDPADYDAVITEIEAIGTTTLSTRRRLAGKAFTAIAAYDSSIADWFRHQRE